MPPRRCRYWLLPSSCRCSPECSSAAAPAWLTSRTDPAEALRGANRSTRDKSSFSQKALVVVQATLSVVLLAGAGLLTRSLLNMQHQDFGFEVDKRVVVSVTAPFSGYPQAKLDAMYRELQDRLSHIPGVESAALALYAPLQDNWGEIVIRQGHGMPGMEEEAGSSWDHVSPGYLETMGQHILRGREHHASKIPPRPRTSPSWTRRS